MKPQLLAPGMKDGDHPCFRPQVLWICRECPYRLPDRMEQDVIHWHRIPETYLIQRFRQGENDMKIAYWQQVLFPVHDPAFTLGSLAFGAMAVSAGVIRYPDVSARITDIHMTSHDHCPAMFNSIERAQMKQWLRVLIKEILTVSLNDLRKLVPWQLQPMR